MRLKEKRQTSLSCLQKLGQKGFTLTEMLIVIALIAMVGTFVVSNLTSKFSRAKVDATKITMRQLGTVLEDFRRDCGLYPTTDQGLDALIEKPSAGPECSSYDPDGYLGRQSGGKATKVPKDGFDTDFLYDPDGTTYVLTSLGSDKREGGEGDAKDIRSDEIE